MQITLRDYVQIIIQMDNDCSNKCGINCPFLYEDYYGYEHCTLFKDFQGNGRSEQCKEKFKVNK